MPSLSRRVQEIFESADCSLDGKISLSEFLHFISEKFFLAPSDKTAKKREEALQRLRTTGGASLA